MMPPPERDDDDAARLALTELELRRRTLAALRQVVHAGSRDVPTLRRLLGVDLERISEDDAALLRALAWRWRRRLPPALAPKLPPHDPLVRAMEGRHPFQQDAANGR